LIKKLPVKIAKSFAAVKKEYGFHLQVKYIHGTYCLFETKTRYDAETRKPVKATSYIGWISQEGVVVPARHHAPKEPQKKAEVERPEHAKGLEIQEDERVKNPETEKHERDILRALSMNARITVSELAKITRLSNTAVNYHLRNLERKYDIKYLLEIDIEKFGYINYIAFVKFKDKKPSYEEIKQQLERIYHVQTAMTTNGIYDMVIFMTVGSTGGVRSTIYDFMKRSFPSYNAELILTPAYQTFGFVPLRDEFFDILKEKVWTRVKERPRPSHDEITEVEYKVLRAMNSNASADFSSIDKKIGADKGRANYAYYKLMNRGIIKRATISMQKLPTNGDMIFILNHTKFEEWDKTRKNLLMEIIKEGRLNYDSYPFTCDIMAPRGVLMVNHVSEGEEVEIKKDTVMNVIKGMHLEILNINSVPVGTVDNRLFDKKETSQFELLVSEYGISQDNILS